jgi:AraC-like DNA-binding protein
VIPVIDAFWSSGGTRASVRVLPDGCADIMFNLERATAVVIGTMTRPIDVDGGDRAFGVRFLPGCAAAILGRPLAPVTDDHDELPALGDLADAVANARDDEIRAALVESFVRHRMERAMPDRRVMVAVDAILRSGGRSAIDDVAFEASTTRQHLARLFAHHVGVAPKVFARVARFRRALRMATETPARWSDLAAELGYFDQSHLIGEFREFAGTTPVPFFQSPSPPSR